MESEHKAISIIVLLFVLLVATITTSCFRYQTARETAAFNAGLCEVTATGNSNTQFTTCPSAK